MKWKRIFTPEFFDIFGLLTFAFILFIGVYSFYYPLSFWMSVVLMIIGLLGMIIDGTIVYRTYLRRKKRRLFRASDWF